MTLRHRKNQRLDIDNRKMLTRLQDAKPSFLMTKFEKDRLKNEKLIANKCKYKHIFGTTSPRLPDISVRTSLVQDSVEAEETIFEPSTDQLPESEYQHDKRILKILSSRKPMKICGDKQPPADRTVLWRNLCAIGGA